MASEEFIVPPLFETARLRARPPRVGDAPAIFEAYASDPAVTRYLAWQHYRDLAPLEEFLRQSETNWATGQGHRPYLLTLKSDGRPIGSIGFDRNAGKVVFGYVLGAAYWGKGYMSEALAFLVDWALAQPGIFRAWAFCDVENPASARVMEKAGMSREGLLRRWHVCPEQGPDPRDCLVYAKVR